MTKKLDSSIPLPSAEDLAKTPPSVLAWGKYLQEKLAQALARIEELESQLKNNSSNSNQPPSSDSPFSKPTTSPEKKARKKRIGVRQQMLEPNEVKNCLPVICACGNNKFTDLKAYYCHQHLEIPQPSCQVTHFILHQGRCSHCHTVVKARVPDEFRFGFGPHVHSLLAELCGVHGMSRGSAQTLLKSLYNLPISQGGIQKCLDRVSKSLIPYYEAIREKAHTVEVNYVDETSWRRFGQNGSHLMWLWVMASSQAVYFSLQKNRNKVAFLSLIGTWCGIIVSDSYGVYIQWNGVARQSCLAHLIRLAQKLKEGTNSDIVACGTWLKDELLRLCRMNHQTPTVEIQAWYMRIQRLVQKYKHLEDEAGKLVRRIQNEILDILTFLAYPDVDPTNNYAERCLRFAVTWRKRSCGTTSEKGDRFVERILSLRHTCLVQGKSTFQILLHALTCYTQKVLPDTSLLFTK